MLSIDEVLNVSIELESGEFSSELLNIRVERETHNHRVFVTEYFTELLIKLYTVFERYKVNEIGYLQSTDLEKRRCCFMELSECWSPFRIHSNVSLF